MLLDFQQLKDSYDINDVKAILHIGAHTCEEHKYYSIFEPTCVMWVDAIQEVVNHNLNNGFFCIQSVIDEIDNNVVDFKITNNIQSSSILNMKTHLTEHPDVQVVQSRKLMTTSLNTLLKKYPINFNFLTLDIQGAELNALKGCDLSNFKYLYLEVNTAELYENVPMMKEIDDYLFPNFKRVETFMTEHGWGDAFYVKM